MSGSGKGLLGLWLYRSGEQEWAVKEGSPLHNQDDLVVNYLQTNSNSIQIRNEQTKKKQNFLFSKIDSVIGFN